jgi:Ca2+-binding RTX toxin-like protein
MRRPLTALALATALLAAGAVLVPAHADDATCNGLPVTMDITQSSGVFVGTGGDDVILVDPPTTDTHIAVYGEGGDDTICLDQVAQAYGSAGDDTLIDQETNGQSFGTVLDGGPGDDVLRGGPGRDTLRGDSGNDELHGGRGDDTLGEGTGTPGDDVVDGGPGVDEDDFGDLTTAVTVDLATNTFSGFGNDTVTSIEDWRGSFASDTLVGGAGDDILQGGPGGQDTIVGGAGDDLLVGPHVGSSDQPAGTAVITGGPGKDQVYAYAGTARTGRGNDHLTVRGPVQATLGAGHDHLFVGVYGGPSVEVHAGPGDDVLWVLALETHHVRSTQIWGDGGADRFKGGPQRDLFRGGPGNDVMRGEAGQDTLIGGAGHDTAYGMGGRDRCAAEVRITCETR